MPCIAFCVCVCVRVLGCVIVPVRIFKTSHYPRYPLLFGFRQNALWHISHSKNSLFRNFKISDSAVEVVVNSTHVTDNKPPTTRQRNAKRNNGYQTTFPEFLEVLKKVLCTSVVPLCISQFWGYSQRELFCWKTLLASYFEQYSIFVRQVCRRTDFTFFVPFQYCEGPLQLLSRT